MALSGSVDFTQDGDSLIRDAMRLAGVYQSGRSPTATEMNDARRVLNRMIKFWHTEDFGLWLKKEATLFLEADKQLYSLGLTGDHCTLSPISTTLSADASSGAATVSVTSATGMVAAQYFAVELDDGTLQWTTISSISDTTVTLAAVLTDDAASGNAVFAYTTKINRPLDLLGSRFRDSSGNDRPVREIPLEQYMNIPDKASAGEIIQVHFVPSTTNAGLYVWQVPTDLSAVLKMTLRMPVQDFDASTDSADFPQEWLDPIVYNLAKRICIEYQKPVPDSLNAMAKELLEAAQSFDIEKESITMGIDPAYAQQYEYV